MKNPYLIFTSAGDSTDAFCSWLMVPKSKRTYDTAVVYYGNDEETWQLIQSSADYSWRHPGFVWTSFVDHYDEVKDYSYSLIIDDDLDLSSEIMDKTFSFARRKDATGLQLSKDKSSWGAYTMFHQNQDVEYRECNFIEQCFMIIRSDLLKMLVGKWKELELTHVTGVDIVLANVARQNNMLPFITLDKFFYYNPHPYDKVAGREIERAYKDTKAFEKRIGQLEKAVASDPTFFRIGPEQWMTSNISFPEKISIYSHKSIVKDYYFTIMSISNRFDANKNKIFNELQGWSYVSDINFCNANNESVALGLDSLGIKDNWHIYPNNRSPLRGEIGHFISTIRTLEYIVNNNIPHLVVLEDDAKLSKGFRQIVEFIVDDKSLDYDFLNLYSNLYIKPDSFSSTTNKLVKKIDSDEKMYGTVGMIYSNAGAKKILEYFKSFGFFTTTDVALYQAAQKGAISGLSYTNSYKKIVGHADHGRQKTEIGPLKNRRPLW